MKTYTESVFQTDWHDMEDAFWSCSSALNKGALQTPVFRVLSLNDPIVNFSHCCEPMLFDNVDQIYLQPEAGHCCAFRYDKELASVIRKWRSDKVRSRHEITSNNTCQQITGN